MTRWALTTVALIAGCSQPVDARFKEELDRAAQERGMSPLPTLRLEEARAYGAARLPDPFYPKGP
jgi:Tfp pilus assembly protein PilP